MRVQVLAREEVSEPDRIAAGEGLAGLAGGSRVGRGEHPHGSSVAGGGGGGDGLLAGAGAPVDLGGREVEAGLEVSEHQGGVAGEGGWLHVKLGEGEEGVEGEKKEGERRGRARGNHGAFS